MKLRNAGWSAYDKLTVGRFNRDQYDDLLTENKATGDLWLYPGNGSGLSGSRTQVGSGWGNYRDLTTADANADGYDDLITIQALTGDLWMYPGTAAGTAFGPRVQIGTGWTGYGLLAVGRINRDGYDDLLTEERPPAPCGCIRATVRSSAALESRWDPAGPTTSN